MTIGERAEDVFYLTGAQGGPLSQAACDHLRESIHQALDRRDAQQARPASRLV
jgi:UTP:GlnB (protein PII) uridylyltransferase